MDGPSDGGSGSLTIVYEPTDDAKPPLFDIIALHGLHGTYEDSFCDKKPDGGLFRALGEISQASPNFRILSYTGTLKLSMHNLLDNPSLRRVAIQLLEALKEATTERPLAFLCHNAAGIVVKELLWIANHDKKYLDIALSARAIFLFGTPTVSSDWDDVILNLVLATTDGSTAEGLAIRKSEISEIVEKGPGALKAASLRFDIIKHQYVQLSIFEDVPLAGLGLVVPNTATDGQTYSIEATHQRLCIEGLAQLKSMVIQTIFESAAGANEDSLRELITSRQILASHCEYDEGLGSILGGQHPPYSEIWIREILDQPSGIYTIYGSAGSGKSVLASQLQEANAFEDSYTLAFYFSQADYRRSSYRDLLLSFLLQLLYKADLDFESAYVRKLLSKMASTRDISAPDLHRLLFAMLIRLSKKPIYCVIDALDACDDVSRDQLVGDFKRIVANGLTSCRVIITSRPTHSTRTVLGPFGEEGQLNLDLRMDTARKAIMVSELADEKFSRIREALENENASPLKTSLIAQLAQSDIHLDVSEFTDYNSIYKVLLDRIDAPPEWLRDVLLCISLAKRPLTVSELASALGVDHRVELSSESQNSFQKIRILAPKRLRDDLELALGSLVRIENNIIHLIHNTLGELVREQARAMSPSEGPNPTHRNWMANQSLLLRKCLLLLRIDGLSNIHDLSTRRYLNDTLSAPPAISQAHSLVRYAVRCWPLHMAEDIDDNDKALTGCFASFWDNTDSRTWWAQTFAFLTGQSVALPDSMAAYEPLQLASTFGILPVVKALLAEKDSNLEIQSALSAAVVKGDVEIVRLLLHGPRRDDEREFWDSALEGSYSHGHARLTKSIISWWSDYFQTPPPVDGIQYGLTLAAINGHWSIFSSYMDDASNDKILTDGPELEKLILEASKNGRNGVVEVLLSIDALKKKEQGQGSEVGLEDAKEEQTVTATIPGESVGSPAQRPMDVTMTDTCVENPGDIIAEWDKNTDGEDQKESPVTELRENVASGRFNEALMQAVQFGDAAVVDLLVPQSEIEHRHLEYPSSWTPLHFAASEGNTEALEILLDRGANIECTDEQDATPLLVACLGESVDAARALLASGANPDHVAARSIRYRAIHIAARSGSAPLVRLLLEHGASENVRLEMPYHDMPLHLAVSNATEDEGYIRTVKTLLMFDADVNAQNGDGYTALHLAIKNEDCSEKMIHLLLDYGADVDKEDSHGHSAIYCAVKEHSIHIRKLWDRYSLYSELGITILFHASAFDKYSRLKQLLAAGYDRTERDQFGRTAYDVASDSSKRDLLAPERSLKTHEYPCKKVEDGSAPQWGWNCDSCGRSIGDEHFYHCCKCSNDCMGKETFDMCQDCYNGRRGASCKEKDHSIHQRFYGALMTSYDEFSSNIKEFGRQKSDRESESGKNEIMEDE